MGRFLYITAATDDDTVMLELLEVSWEFVGLSRALPKRGEGSEVGQGRGVLILSLAYIRQCYMRRSPARARRF